MNHHRKEKINKSREGFCCCKIVPHQVFLFLKTWFLNVWQDGSYRVGTGSLLGNVGAALYPPALGSGHYFPGQQRSHPGAPEPLLGWPTWWWGPPRCPPPTLPTASPFHGDQAFSTGATPTGTAGKGRAGNLTPRAGLSVPEPRFFWIFLDPLFPTL